MGITKGEWKSHKGWVSWDEGDIQLIKDSKGVSNIAFIPSGEHCIANANLIAAAPDLYEALKDAREIFTQYDATNGVVSGISLKLNEALAKAEGKDG